MRVQRLIKETCKIVSEDVGEVKAAQIARSAQNRYEALCAENSSDSKELRSHSYKRIYPGIAVYEAMRAEDISQEKAVWYIREYFQRLAAKRVPFSRGPLKRLAWLGNFLTFLWQVLRKAVNQTQDLSMSFQKAITMKLESILSDVHISRYVNGMAVQK